MDKDTEILWVNNLADITLQELAQLSGIPEAELHQYIEEGAIIPKNPHDSLLMFSAHYHVTVREARRLREDFELDSKGVAVAISLLNRIHQLEDQLHKTQVLKPE